MKTDKIEGDFRKEIQRVESKHFLILDDWGLTPLDTPSRLALLQIIENRHNKYATIITSGYFNTNFTYLLILPTTAIK